MRALNASIGKHVFRVRANFFTEKNFKSDPHNFNIYKKIKPNLGKAPPVEPVPDFVKTVMPPNKDLQYHPIDAPESLRFALNNNFPIIRESLSAFYRVHKDGITYHVFNGARVVSQNIKIFSHLEEY